MSDFTRAMSWRKKPEFPNNFGEPHDRGVADVFHQCHPLCSQGVASHAAHLQFGGVGLERAHHGCGMRISGGLSRQNVQLGQACPCLERCWGSFAVLEVDDGDHHQHHDQHGPPGELVQFALVGPR